MRILATLLVVLTLGAGLPRAARAAGRAGTHCCCPKSAHAHREAPTPQLTRTCPCEARPAPPSKLPGSAPAAELAPRRDDAAPLAVVLDVAALVVLAAPGADVAIRTLAARAPPPLRSLLALHASLVV